MPARLKPHDARRISKDALRSKTAELLHEVYKGAVKMVAANRPPHGVSTQRIYRETAGDDANRLELLCEDLDRITLEKGAEAIAPVLAFLNARYGLAGAGAQDGVLDDLAEIAKAAGNLLAHGIEVAQDGIDRSELDGIELHVERIRNLTARYLREAQAAAGRTTTKGPSGIVREA